MDEVESQSSIEFFNRIGIGVWPVLAKHFPNSNRVMPNTIYSDGTNKNETVNIVYARTLYCAGLSPHGHLNTSTDGDKLARLTQLAGSINEVIRSMEPSTNISLAIAYIEEPYIQSGEHKPFDEIEGRVLNDVLCELEHLRLAARRLFLKTERKAALGNRVNLPAAAVFMLCCKIWASEKWYCQHEGLKRDQLLRYFFAYEPTNLNLETAFRSFVDRVIPKAIHHTRPGPFGRFVEDVFEVTPVIGRQGKPVSAATAMASLKRADVWNWL